MWHRTPWYSVMSESKLGLLVFEWSEASFLSFQSLVFLTHQITSFYLVKPIIIQDGSELAKLEFVKAPLGRFNFWLSHKQFLNTYSAQSFRGWQINNTSALPQGLADRGHKWEASGPDPSSRVVLFGWLSILEKAKRWIWIPLTKRVLSRSSGAPPCPVVLAFPRFITFLAQGD